MANKKITDLPIATSAANTDLFYVGNPSTGALSNISKLNLLQGSTLVNYVDTATLLTTKGLVDGNAFVVKDKHEVYIYSATTTTCPTQVLGSDGGFWIPQFWLPNNATGFVTSANQLNLGSQQLPIDSGVVFQGGTPISITQNFNTSNQNPQYISMSVPDTTTANGMCFGTFGGSSRVYPKLYFNSNFGETGTYDKGVVLQSIMTEVSSSSLINTAFTFSPRKRVSSTQFWQDSPLTDPKSVIIACETSTGGVTTMNSSRLAWAVRYSGDMHLRGSLYKNVSIVTGDFTPTLNINAYKYTGTGSNTITLPSATDVDNLNRVIEIYNFGTNPLALSVAVYLDGTNTITSLPATYPDNKLVICSDNINWYKIN